MTEAGSDLYFDFDLEEEILKKKKKKKAEEARGAGYITEAVSFIGPDGPVAMYELAGEGTEYGEPDPDDPIWVEWALLVEARRLGADAVHHAMENS